jgi:hypothetical protein
MKDTSWNWPEDMFRRIPMPYPVVSYFIFIILYLIYWFFSTKVYWFEWNTYHNFQSLTTSILVAYLLIGMQFILDKTRDTFRYIDLLYDRGNNFYIKLEEMVVGSHWYYIILVSSVMAPFIISSWGSLPYYDLEPKNMWALCLDIYGYFLLLIILSLLAEIVWLVINVVWSLNQIGCLMQDISVKIDAFSIGMKLRPVRNFLLIFIIHYFLALTLAMSTYLGPSNRFPYELIFFVALLVVGVVLFFCGMEAIQRIINCRVESELDILNKKRGEQHKFLINILSQGDFAEKNDQINYISTTSELLQKERDSLMEVNRRAYDITAISVFIGSFLIPFLTLLEKLRQLMP